MIANIRIWGWVIILSLCFPITSPADDLITFNQGARAAAMANAFIARADDPSAVWYNPAGIIGLEGVQIYGGGLSIIAGDRSYYSEYRNKTLVSESDPVFRPMFYLSYRLSKRIALGLAVNAPNDYSLYWPKTRDVEHLVYVVKKLQINTLSISPVVAVQVSDHFSLGAGLSINRVQFNLQYHYPYDINVMVALLTNGKVMDVPEVQFDLADFETTAISYFAGLKWSLGQKISLAAVYRRGYPLSFDSGQVTASEPRIDDPYVNAKLSALFPDSPQQTAAISFSLVDQLTVGAALRIGESLAVELDLGMIFWSQMEHITVDYGLETNFAAAWTGYWDIEAPFHFKDAAFIRLGAEFALTDSLDLRGGAFYTGPPLEEEDINPALPFTKSSGFSLGLGYHRGRISLDAAYVNRGTADFEGRSSTYGRWGDYGQKYLARVDQSFLFSLGYRF